MVWSCRNWDKIFLNADLVHLKKFVLLQRFPSKMIWAISVYTKATRSVCNWKWMNIILIPRFVICIYISTTDFVSFHIRYKMADFEEIPRTISKGNISSIVICHWLLFAYISCLLSIYNHIIRKPYNFMADKMQKYCIDWTYIVLEKNFPISIKMLLMLTCKLTRRS